MKTIYTLLLFFTFSFTYAQYEVSGTVIGENNAPLAAAQVLWTSYGSEGLDYLTITEEDGTFRIKDLAPGRYTMTASYVGYKDIIKTMEVDGDTLDLVIILDRDAMIDEVLVTGIRVDQDDPFTYSNLSEESLESRNLGQDIPILTKFMPGVTTSSDAGAGIGYTYMRVRGSDGTRINVTINGVPYNDAESQGTYWVDLPDMASSTNSIQLQRGVGTSTNGGSAFGASLNLLTDGHVEDSYVQLSTAVGSYNTNKGTVKFGLNTLEDKLSLSGRLSTLHSDGYVDRAYSDLNGYTLQAAYNHPKRYIKVLAFGGHEETYQAWYGLTQEELDEDRQQNPYTYENEVDNYRQDHTQLHWNELLNEKWTARFTLNYTKGKGYFEQFEGGADPSLYNNAFHPTAEDGTADIAVRRWLDNNFYFGYLSTNYVGEKLNLDAGISYGNYIGDHYGEVHLADNFAKEDRQYYFSDSEKVDLSAYVKSTWNLLPSVSAYIDLQGRNIDYQTEGTEKDNGSIAVDTTYTFFNPKVGVNWLAPNGGNAYISYARANREPNRDDFQNGVTSHETMDNVELGYRKRESKYYYGINAYLMYYKNQLVLTGAINDVGAPVRATSGESYRQGIEIEGGYNFTDQLELYANATLSRNKNVDYVDQFNGEVRDLGLTDISFSPDFISSAILTYKLDDNFNISLYNKYVSSQYMSNTESEASKLNDYMLQDVGITYTKSLSKGAKEIRLKLLINNIANVEYVDRGYYYTYDIGEEGNYQTIEGTGYYPQATRNFLVGIDLLF